MCVYIYIYIYIYMECRSMVLMNLVQNGLMDTVEGESVTN